MQNKSTKNNKIIDNMFLNILHTETLKDWGGQQGKVLKELLSIQRLGHKVYLICNPNTKISMRARELGIETIELEMNKKNYYHTIPFIIRFLKEHKIKIAISHGSTDSWIIGIAGLFLSTKTIRERHNEFSIKGFISRSLHKYLFDHIFAVSNNVKDVLLAIQVPEEKITLLPSIIDVSLFKNTDSLRSEFNIPSDSKVVGMFSSHFRKAKGGYDFSEMAKILLSKYKELYIIFAGNYTEKFRKSIEADFITQGFDLTRIIWTGFRKDISHVIHTFDIAVYPSHTEGMPNALLEVMACGKPIVVYDIKPMNQIIKNKIHGYCVPFGDTGALANATSILLEDESSSKKMGANALQKVKAEHDIHLLDFRLKELFEKLYPMEYDKRKI